MNTNKRYFLYLNYDGTGFHGWQIQPNAVSVQETIEQCLSKVFNSPTGIVGCGRTDTGVHAKSYVAHFEVDEKIDVPMNLVHKLNCMLPESIAIQSMIEVDKELHARFSALSREYRYYISTQKDPFKSKYAWWLTKELDLDVMKVALSTLLNVKDFTSFAKLHTDNKTNLCDMYHVELNKTMDGIEIVLVANRFLRNMVRALVGTLVEVGLGKITLDEFKQIVDQKDRSAAGASAPANGLFLWEIKYPELK